MRVTSSRPIRLAGTKFVRFDLLEETVKKRQPRSRILFSVRSESVRYCAPIQYRCLFPSLNEVPSHAEGMAGDPGADSPVGAVPLLFWTH